MFGNSYINFTTKSTCLGVVIDHKLNWKLQVNILHTVWRETEILEKNESTTPICVLEEIYCKGIVPSIASALPCGDPAHCLYFMNWSNRTSKLLN